jgi:hypothetical protein
MWSAFFVPEHVGVAWKLLEKQCTFGNQGFKFAFGGGGEARFSNS